MMGTCKEAGKHLRPVHLNTGKQPHTWICIACETILAGPKNKFTVDEVKALAQWLEQINGPYQPQQKEKQMGKLSLTIEFDPGSTAEAIAAGLRFQANLIEGKTGKEAAAVSSTPKKTAPAVAAEEAADDDFGAKKKPVKKTAPPSFDDDAAEDKPKSKKITPDDLNDACRAKAEAEGGGKKGRAAVLALLDEHFSTQSVADIEPKDYNKFMKVMAVAE